jgi:putative ABC transport system permease protein
MLIKYPTFSLVTLLTLALGIGANAAMFSVINAVLLRPLPYHDPDRLLAISTTDITRGNTLKPVSYPAFLDWRSQTRSLDSLSAWRLDDFTLMGRDEALHITGAVVSANTFSTLGVTPALGRTFTQDEDQPTSLAVILSHELWEKQFGTDRNVLGRTLTVDGHMFSIVGVMPAGFQFPIQNTPVELWMTIAVDALPTPQGQPLTAQRGLSYLNVLARRKPNASMEEVQTDLDRIQQVLNRSYPENRPRGMHIVTEVNDVVGDMRKPLLFLFGAVTLVLMIACANVANLLLTRYTARQKEFAIRSALGATRGTVIRQLLTESMLLSCLGGCLGLLLTFLVPMLVRLAPGEFNRVEARLDFRIFIFTLGVAVITGIFFGLFPAFSRTGRRGLSGALKAAGRSGTSGVGSRRTRSTILFAQVALTTVLLSGAGLLLHSMVRLAQTNPGFSSDHVVTFGLSLPSRYAGAKRSQFYSQLLDQIRQLQGVRRASIVQGVPMGSTEHQVTTAFGIEGRPTRDSEKPTAELHMNDFDYFHTMGIPLISGRDFTQHDDENSTPVVVINQTAARHFFPGEDPVGKRIHLDVDVGKGSPTCEIIGTVGDVRSSTLGAEQVPELYVPVSQLPVANVTVVVRTIADPESLVPQLRNQVKLIDRELPLRDVETLESYVNASIAVPRFSTVLLGTFAVLSLALTAVGLYGVIADSVAQRTREIGIRLALGAQRVDIAKLVIKEGVVLVSAGALIGLGGSFVLQRTVGRWTNLYAITSGDIGVFLGVIALLILIVCCVSYIPALRAVRVDPVIALRQE